MKKEALVFRWPRRAPVEGYMKHRPEEVQGQPRAGVGQQCPCRGRSKGHKAGRRAGVRG